MGKIGKRVLRTLLWTLIGVVTLVILAVVALYIPPVQTAVKDFALGQVRKSSGLDITAGEFRLRFPLSLTLGDVAVVEASGDTMATLSGLEADVSLLPLLRGEIEISGAKVTGAYYAMGQPDSAMMLRARVSSLDLSGGSLSLVSGKIHVDHAGLDGADVSLFFNDTVPAQPADTTATSSSPLTITADAIDLANVRYTMVMLPVIDSLGAFIPSASMRSAIVDMDKRMVDAESLSVDSVTATYLTPDSAYLALHPAASDTVTAAPVDMGEMWTVTARSVSLTAREATYAVSGALPLPGLDMSYLQVGDVSIKVDSFRNRGPEISVPLRELKATERCGVSLSASGLFSMDSAAMRVSGFEVSTGFSTLSLEALMGMGDLAADPGLPVRLQASGSISPVDVRLAMPSLARIVAALPPASDINLDADISGTSGQMEIGTLSAIIPGMARVYVDGSIANPFDFNSMDGRVNMRGSFTGLNAVKPTLLEAKLAKSLNFPAMTLAGTVRYKPGHALGDVTLTAADGRMALEGSWVEKAEGYMAELKVDSFPVDAFMPSLGIGKITAEARVKGNGFDFLSPRTALDASLTLHSVDYLGREYTDAVATVTLADSHAAGTITSNNPEAEIGIDFLATLTRDSIIWDIDGDITNLDLRAMKLSPTPLEGSLSIVSTGQMSPSDGYIRANAAIKNLDWNLDGKHLYAAETDLSLNSDSSVTVTLSSGDLRGEMVALCPLDTLLARVTATLSCTDTIIARRSADIVALQRAMPPVDMYLTAGPRNIIADYLAADGVAFGNASLWLRNDSLISLNTSVTGISTASTRIDTISFGAAQHGRFLAYKGAMNNRPGTFDQFAHVNISGFLSDNKLSFLLAQRNIRKERGFFLGLNLDMTDSVATARFVPYTPTIGYKQWTLNSDNFLSYNLYTRHIDANLALSTGDSYLKIFTEHNDADPRLEDIIVQLSKIKIEDWLSISPFAPPVKGNIGANLRIHWDEQQLTGKGSVGLTDFYYGRDKVGSFDLDVNVSSSPSGLLRAETSLMVDSIKVITANGVLNDSTASHPFLLDFSMIHLPLRILNPFLPADYARLSGMLNGRMDITGSIARPVFNGFLDFDSTAVNVGMLGTDFKFSEEKIPVDSSIVRFDNFTIKAANSNPLAINGTVDLTELSAMKLNLALTARNMQIVNSSRPRKADVYGKAFIDLDAKVRGGMSLMDIDASLTVLPGTNVTYILSSGGSALASQSTGDMVKFVQFGDTAAVLAADSITTAATAINLNAELRVRQGSTINVDLSPDGKNKVSIIGQGDLDFSMNPFSDGRLTGRFNINGGFVRYSPPMMGEKLFNFEEGSFISFNGDMLNPILNIRAVDRLKANVTQSGQNSRLINFDISLAITNTLQNMNVAFDLSTKDDITVQNELSSMSPDQRANQAMNLLLYNVYSGPGTKASSSLGGNPLYSFLENQLNSWAANNIRGVDISFGIDQYDKTTDGVSSQTTSYSYRVSKTLFNDRFKIIVGGNYSTDANSDENFSQNLINDIAFEYMLNRSGSMYVRIFRHTGYESILEGEITQTGVGFVLRRKINSVKDLFRWAGRLKRSLTGENRKKAEETAESTHTSVPHDEKNK